MLNDLTESRNPLAARPPAARLGARGPLHPVAGALMGRDARLNPQSKESPMELAATTLDARGRPLQEGDELIVQLKGQVFFTIVKIQPVVDPLAPANMLTVELQATLKFAAVRGSVNPEFIRVLSADEVREEWARRQAQSGAGGVQV